MGGGQLLQDLGGRLRPPPDQPLDGREELPLALRGHPLGRIRSRAFEGPRTSAKQRRRGIVGHRDGLLQPTLRAPVEAYGQEQLAAVLIEALGLVARAGAGVEGLHGTRDLAEAVVQPSQGDGGLGISRTGLGCGLGRRELLFGGAQRLPNDEPAFAPAAAETGLGRAAAAGASRWVLVFGGILQRERHPTPLTTEIRPPQGRA